MENNTGVYYQLRFYEKRGIIFYQGEYGDCMYEVQQGTVGVYQNYEQDDEVLLTKLGPGDYFGEMAIIEACPRTATIVALEPNTIIRLIGAKDFPRYAADNPDKVLKIMYSMGSRAQALQKQYIGACELIHEFLDCHAKLKEYSTDLLAKAVDHDKQYRKSKGNGAR